MDGQSDRTRAAPEASTAAPTQSFSHKGVIRVSTTTVRVSGGFRARCDRAFIVASRSSAMSRTWAAGPSSRLIHASTTGRAAVEFQFDGRRAVLDLNTGRLASPLTTDLLRSFKCPGSSA